MTPENLLKQIAFIKEIDKIKYIQRKTKLFSAKPNYLAATGTKTTQNTAGI